MKTLNYKIITLFFILITSIAGAQDDFSKKFHKEYDVSKSSNFEIANRFGDIKIENTNADKITIDAEIIVKARSQDKADRIMSKISVNIAQNRSDVSAITKVNNINNASFEINYVVVMPAYLNTNLSNNYGNVTINELHGKSNLAVKYGSLNVNKMLDGNEKPLSSIELGYCENSRVNEINWAKISIQYSKLEIGSGKAVAISSKYSKLRIGQFSSIVAEAGYDDYEIDKVSNLKITAKYTNINLNQLTKKFIIENEYGNITVTKIPDGFKEIDVLSKYAKIRLGIASEANYKIKAKSKYADIKYNDLNIQQRIKEDNGIEISGFSGSESTESTVNIDTKYGNADLRE
ncbi:MAG: hypothetical protein PF517_22575 [Salinivirgaceae bacterium]|jgi:hypothetical protein|nr:hypothetical protein [Salinivirgaceae bacterium]